MSHPDVVLSLGSNVGDSLANLRAAVDALGDSVRAVSSVYRTPPWGGVEQDDFLNIVVLASDRDDRRHAAADDPRRWLARCQELESAAGRVREVRWGPRTLDVDVVAIGDLVFSDDEITVPHPLAAERAFVLLPWAELDPSARLPGSGPIEDLLARMDLTGIEKVGSLS